VIYFETGGCLVTAKRDKPVHPDKAPHTSQSHGGCGVQTVVEMPTSCGKGGKVELVD